MRGRAFTGALRVSSRTCPKARCPRLDHGSAGSPCLAASSAPCGQHGSSWRRAIAAGPTVEEPLLDARLRGVTVEDPIRTLERATGKLPIEQVSPRSLILSDGFRHSDLAPSDSTLLASRAISAAVALFALVVFSPAFALIAPAIVLDSTRAGVLRAGTHRHRRPSVPSLQVQNDVFDRGARVRVGPRQ